MMQQRTIAALLGDSLSHQQNKKIMADEGGDEGGLSLPSIGITSFVFLSLSLYLLLCVDRVHLRKGSKA